MRELKEKERHVKGKINLYIVRYPVGVTSGRDLGSKYKEWKRVGRGKWRTTHDNPISFQ